MSTVPTRPRVSIIVPCYNHERFVRETIESIRGQTYPEIELIVIDDASSDGTAGVVEELRGRHEFTFLRNERNLGLNATIERGLAHATGEFATTIASDDVMLPTKIEEQVAWLLGTGHDAVLSTGFSLRPDGTREKIDLDAVAERFATGSALRHMQTSDTNGPLMQSGLFRTTMLRELAPVRRQFKSDDWAVAIRMLEDYRVGFLNRPLFLYRQHPENTYRDYWRTFPMRVEVLSILTPEPLRLEGMANLFESQASYLAADGKRSAAMRFLLAAIVLDAPVSRGLRMLRDAARARLGRLRLRLGLTRTR